MARAKATIDHDTIRQWVESRGGCPAHVKGTGQRKGDPGILRIDYPGFGGKESLEEISWETFFEAFDKNELAFLYQDEDDSRFSKLVARDGVDLEDGAGGARRTQQAQGLQQPRTAAGQGPDAIELLKGQHREVESLFAKIKSAKGPSQRERPFLQLANALAAHARIEETLFYPAAFDDDTEDELRESVEEHLVAKRLLADLLEMEPSDPQFMGKITVLEEVIRHHVKEEENTLFPQVRDHTGEDLAALGREMKERYDELMQGEPSQDIPDETDAAVIEF